MAFGQVSCIEIKEVPRHSGEIMGRQCHCGMRKVGSANFTTRTNFSKVAETGQTCRRAVV